MMGNIILVTCFVERALIPPEFFPVRDLSSLPTTFSQSKKQNKKATG
jgi:hypothetical protein